MITTPKMLGLLAVAFVAGSFVASPELRAYAAATIGSAEIIDETILKAKLVQPFKSVTEMLNLLFPELEFTLQRIPHV